MKHTNKTKGEKAKLNKREREMADLLNTATAVSLAHEADYHHKMMLELAVALLTGEINSRVIRYAEMLIDIDKKERELFK